MLRKIYMMCINIIFPKTHLETFLENCSKLEFLNLCTTKPQFKKRMFHPFQYKNKFIKDCIIELKERNNQYVAKYFSEILSQGIMRELTSLHSCHYKNIYLVPIPQHKNKTKEKGFCHTTTLTKKIYMYLLKNKLKNIFINPCIVKYKNTKKAHNTKSKNSRFNTLKNSMCSYVIKQEAQKSYFFLIDDVYTSGATFKEARRSLLDSGVPDENIYFISIAH